MKTDPRTIASLSDLRAYFGIKNETWDAILVTDGSATTWKTPAGWAGWLFIKGEINPRQLVGGFNHGSNNVAELMAVFQAVLTITEDCDYVRDGGYNLYVITDSQYVANGLKDTNVQHLSTLGSNRPIWLGIHGGRRKGLNIVPLFLGRDQIRPNKWCHDAANDARRAVAKVLDTTAQKWKPEEVLPE